MTNIHVTACLCRCRCCSRVERRAQLTESDHSVKSTNSQIESERGAKEWQDLQCVRQESVEDDKEND
eukprot:4228428-Amphidinium_carterae.1